MNKFISFLIIMGGLTGGYFVFQDYANGVKVKNNHWADDLRTAIKAYVTEAQSATNDSPGASETMSYYRMVGVIQTAERHGFFPGDVVRNAFSGSGVRPGESKMAMDLLLENYRAAKQLGVFDVTANVLKLERGEAPVCSAKGWEGEPLVIGHILSPLMAPEASYSLANVVLMPKVARDTQNEDLTGFSPELAKKWLSEHIITIESHEAISKVLAAKKF